MKNLVIAVAMVIVLWFSFITAYEFWICYVPLYVEDPNASEAERLKNMLDWATLARPYAEWHLNYAKWWW